VVWNVEDAPEFSLEPKTWWYPLLGSLTYRGYFSKSGATNYATYLRAKGYDVSVGGVSAYSTLGWFKDPVLNTFIFEDDAELVKSFFTNWRISGFCPRRH
jgi:predicted aminopeptidase